MRKAPSISEALKRNNISSSQFYSWDRQLNVGINASLRSSKPVKPAQTKELERENPLPKRRSKGGLDFIDMSAIDIFSNTRSGQLKNRKIENQPHPSLSPLFQQSIFSFLAADHSTTNRGINSRAVTVRDFSARDFLTVDIISDLYFHGPDSMRYSMPWAPPASHLAD